MSRVYEIMPVMKALEEVHPLTILDVGVDIGLYGLLFRRYLDVEWAKGEIFNPHTWNLSLVGIEQSQHRITPIHDYIYNDVWVGDAKEILCMSNASHLFDMVFLGDILRYYEHPDGEKLIKCTLKNWLSPKGSVLIATPNHYNSEHKSRWYAQEFRELGLYHNVEEIGNVTVALLKI